jgi:hypothetical protein
MELSIKLENFCSVEPEIAVCNDYRTLMDKYHRKVNANPLVSLNEQLFSRISAEWMVKFDKEGSKRGIKESPP